jgi:hypothetical protein
MRLAAAVSDPRQGAVTLAYHDLGSSRQVWPEFAQAKSTTSEKLCRSLEIERAAFTVRPPGRRRPGRHLGQGARHPRLGNDPVAEDIRRGLGRLRRRRQPPRLRAGTGPGKRSARGPAAQCLEVTFQTCCDLPIAADRHQMHTVEGSAVADGQDLLARRVHSGATVTLNVVD